VGRQWLGSGSVAAAATTVKQQQQQQPGTNHAQSTETLARIRPK